MLLEALPPFYRKVGLNGRPLCDTEPNRQKRTDAEAELTCVDALTLQVRHQTTDVYVPLAGTDFALNVQRNNFATTWSASGLTTAQRPDLPFGNCWRSGLGASLHRIDRGIDFPVEIVITDEQGMAHRFVELFKDGYSAGFYPLPNIESDEDGRVMSLIRQGNEFVFRRKFGARMFFNAEKPAVEIAIDTPTRETHSYYRLRRVQHYRGGYLNYVFNKDNSGIIPDEITFVRKRLQIRRNARGYVDRIVDPRGAEQFYEYAASSVPGGAPLLVGQVRPEIQGTSPKTIYAYAEMESPAGTHHAAISLIADPLGNTYQFRHTVSQSVTRGLQVTEIDLPSKTGTSRFRSHQVIKDSRIEKKATFITDAAGNGVLYEFSGREIATLKGLPWRRKNPTGSSGEHDIVLAGWHRQDISYFQGSRYRFDSATGRTRPLLFTRRLLTEFYEFEPAAGFALKRAVDGEGRATSFSYGDALARPQLSGVVPPDFVDPFSINCRDVTETVNPLGGVRRLVYHPTNRVLVRRVDELGHVTVWEVHEETGCDYSLTVYASAEDEQKKLMFSRTEWEFNHPDYPAFVTRKIVRKTNFQPDSPKWECDLIREYEANENGNIVREVADPSGLKMTWRYEYDENNNKLSNGFPDDYYVQFRYDPLNRLVRAYRPHRSVKKTWFDLRGNKLRELEPNGDSTEWSYDGVVRVLRKTVFIGKENARKVEVSSFAYNAVNSKIAEHLPGSRIKKFRFDGMQRVTLIHSPLTKPTIYSYSANGCSNLFRKSSYMASMYYANASHRRYLTYDGLQNKIRENSGPVQWYANLFPALVTIKYDLAGNKIEEREGHRVTRYEYNAAHELVLTRYPAGWKRILRTSTGLEFGTEESTGARTEKLFDSAGYEITT